LSLLGERRVAAGARAAAAAIATWPPVAVRGPLLVARRLGTRAAGQLEAPILWPEWDD
jgi:hypothetical protein